MIYPEDVSVGDGALNDAHDADRNRFTVIISHWLNDERSYRLEAKFYSELQDRPG